MIATQSISFQQFLELPETEPASEFINGKIIQKPMPKRKHSLLQSELCTAINQAAKPEKIAYAFPELRCSFGDRSLVPDIAVLQWQNIEFDASGEPVDDVLIAPDWTIEILSPNQSANQVTGKILHCLNHGTQLGWLLDPSDRSILVFVPNQVPMLYTQVQVLPVLSNLMLELSPDQIFGWLQME
jgi:Uma2 family endonuclease